MQFRNDDCDLLANNPISIALTGAVHLIGLMPFDLPDGPEWPRMAPNGPRGQWQDRNARLRKRGNRVIFPEAGSLPPGRTSDLHKPHHQTAH
ncbi:hypothetical protein AUP40_10500 [Thalassospira xiamenensis]|uniref:Uncharacterized protein n=1 Tax=Thalassospira xiamenensis TaxID=220697 RepID=A0ABR5Y8N5_9PROT|nr:hypothetical protein AUP40_10500 [Thalassospira xiamenensis]MAB32495.1 hypothetical protein [Thalassospira sp.]OHY99829.1 hypothetical protein BC440_18425 [Thalassospira sp. MIT1004]MBA06575.1 hypothetical protein [Thalassospira sp.]HBN49322.1 hypothetical protein [Thalassospira sp.]